jgi:3-hydroxyacyl-CoA dehydrogenase
MSLVDYERRGDIAVLRLNAPPVNAITFAVLDELRAVVRRANADPAVRGLIITGNDRHFSAGADINLFREKEPVEVSRTFQEAFQEIEDSAKPVAAVVAGNVMGGALELAMACHFRVCAPGSRFAMPEVKLGIVPGAGGTQRLPRLIGAGPALKMLLNGDAIKAEEALALGLIDAIGEFDWINKPIVRTRNRAVQGEFTTAETRPELIAPSRILAAVKAESYEDGLRAEQTGFADCMKTLATRNKIYMFFAIRQCGAGLQPAKPLSKDGQVANLPHTIARAGVVGMGSMGAGIAQALIMAGVPVVVFDENAAAVERALKQIRGRDEKLLRLVRVASGWEDLAEAELVIEAVFEDVAVKRAVIVNLEKVCRADAIIASNTSTLSLDDLAEGMKYPERLVGLHFFNPAHRMPLVEVIHRNATPSSVTATALGFVKAIRKTPVLVRNREGFVVNRMFVPYLNEAFRLLEEGAEARAIDRAMVEFGFPMGPFVLIDMAGLDILEKTAKVMSRAFPSHGPTPAVVTKLVEGGHLGQKTGSGVYRYEKGDRQPHDSEVTAQILRELRTAPREFTGEEIAKRLVERMIREAVDLMKEGVVQRESDVDVATVLGLGFPDWRGGVLKYAHDLNRKKDNYGN